MFNAVSITLILVVVFALVFDFINGFHDTANSIATVVSTRVLSPKAAILMAGGLNFIGALMSNKVANTISQGIIVYEYGTDFVVVCAIVAAIIWNLITWYFGIPSSSSHALIGGLIGATIVHTRTVESIKWSEVGGKIFIPLLLSPIIGFIIGYIFLKILHIILKPFSCRLVNNLFSKLQILSAAFMAYSHGNNDAQKSMGIITLALISTNILPKGSEVPLWVMILCAVAMGTGTLCGGWKIIKTVGSNIIKLQPLEGFAAETGAAMVIEAMTFIGAPVSTTHVVTSSIMGVGTAKRFTAVRWSVVKNIVSTWIVTIFVAASIGGALVLVYNRLQF